LSIRAILFRLVLMVIAKAKQLRSKLLPQDKRNSVTAESVQPARDYIDAYWKKLVRHNVKDNGSLIGLPKPYLVPASEEGHDFDFNELYYWDSYFMIQGMLNDPGRKEFVLGILEDLFSLYHRFKIIPNASRTYLMGRSQPPLLTSFILDVYNAYGMDEKWLERSMEIAKDEYHTVWLGTAKPNMRLVYRGLSRYYDINHLSDLAEAESGWDHTIRFSRKCLEFLPVDLNALLYKYEKDFEYVAELLGDKEETVKWNKAAKHRARTMKELMWSDLKGLYYDYRYTKETRGNVESLAAYFPMWAGLATEQQAARLVSSLRRFEKKGGLTTTDAQPLGKLVPGPIPAQWAYPNGWAPLHFIAIKGLERYGYHEEARRIALKWIMTNLEWYKNHGVFLEKYNVVSIDKPPEKGVYPTQFGFGWSNAVFEYLCQKYIDNQPNVLNS
jgi:alpha,alpha-trehalase